MSVRNIDNIEYQLFLPELTSLEVARLYGTLETSKVLEVADESVLGRLNHVVLRGTAKPVGYIGADNQVELINPGDKYLVFARIYFEGLVNQCLEENQRKILER
ncbi:hypothetical protein J4474_01925 [Candidatus Pacearchaeota archaeon]|nr:hypothetical protein [Candidatus Pacearchaeota archaeon]